MNAFARGIFYRSPKVAVSVCDDAFFFQRHGSAESLRIGALVGVRPSDGKIVTVGDAHLQLEEVRVLESGAVVDMAGTVAILRTGFRQLFPRRFSRARPIVVAATSLSGERSLLLQQAALEAGAREIFLIQSPMAALISLREDDVQKPEPCAVLIVSNDWFVFAIASLSNITASCRGRIGVEEMLADTRIHCRKTRDFLPDEKEIAAALLRDGFTRADDLPAGGWTTWLGKAGVGKHAAGMVDAGCLRDGALPTILRISERIKTLIESLPAETRTKLHSTTIEGTGCAMEIPGFARMLEAQLGIRIRTHAGNCQPTLAGAIRAIDEIPKLPQRLIRESRD